jgi:large subunit ribosomal protein L23
MTIIKPVISQKSKEDYLTRKICTFFVLPGANKFEIRNEFENLFSVKVKKIRTLRNKPVLQKEKYLRRNALITYTKLNKKAFIELMPDQELKNIFE